MTLNELNSIIAKKYNNLAVLVPESIYPTIEQFYLSNEFFTKEFVADFWIKHDYQGVVNSIELIKLHNAGICLKELTPAQRDCVKQMFRHIEELN